MIQSSFLLCFSSNHETADGLQVARLANDTVLLFDSSVLRPDHLRCSAVHTGEESSPTASNRVVHHVIEAVSQLSITLSQKGAYTTWGISCCYAHKDSSLALINFTLALATRGINYPHLLSADIKEHLHKTRSESKKNCCMDRH
eukprot:1162083-Pelagomonas_calceolata.AAC.16